MLKTTLVLTLLALVSNAYATSACVDLFVSKKFEISHDLDRYESARDPSKVRRIQNYKSGHGWDGQHLRVLVDNPKAVVRLVGDFNGWKARPQDQLSPSSKHPEIFEITSSDIKPGDKYMLEVDGKLRLDPAALKFTAQDEGELRSVFIDQSKGYQKQTDFVKLGDEPAIVGEVEVHSLVAKYKGGPKSRRDTYRYIAESGVIEHLKDMGYNAIEMLPFNQAVDGESWRFRYQVFGLFAPDANFGTPAEFKMMIDAFHKHKIAVLMDVVISHFPEKNEETNQRDISEIGPATWTKADGTGLFAKGGTPWRTRRYDYSNPFVRRYLVDSIAYMMTEFGIDGLRIDNVDSNGIIDQDGGYQYLHEMNTMTRAINPHALIIGEAFSPIDDLVRRSDRPHGLGFNALNDGNLFEGYRWSMQARHEDLNMNDLGRRIRSAHEWLRPGLVRYLSNHDEAANPREGFTGQYPASMITDQYHAFGKVKAAEILNMTSGAYHLSLPQGRIMQKGNFSHQPEIDWSQAETGSGRQLNDVLAAVSKYVRSKPSFFGFKSLHADIENSVDNVSKVITLRRVDPRTGREIYIAINMGYKTLRDYQFGVNHQGSMKVAFDSETTAFDGRGQFQHAVSQGRLHTINQPLNQRSARVQIPVLAPYSAVILETE